MSEFVIFWQAVWTVCLFIALCVAGIVGWAGFVIWHNHKTIRRHRAKTE